MTAKELKDLISRTYSDDDVIVAYIWAAQDIVNLARDRHIKISHEQANEILMDIEDNKDRADGIAWDTIEIAIETFASDL